MSRRFTLGALWWLVAENIPSLHMTKSPRSHPSAFVMCKWSRLEVRMALKWGYQNLHPAMLWWMKIWYITWQPLLICIQSASVVPFITKETYFKLILAVSICFLFHEVLHNLIVTFLCCIMEWGHLQMNTRYTYQSEYRPASHHHYVWYATISRKGIMPLFTKDETLPYI